MPNCTDGEPGDLWSEHFVPRVPGAAQHATSAARTSQHAPCGARVEPLGPSAEWQAVRWTKAHMSKTVTVYVYLLDEGVDVWRPVQATHIKGDTYRIESSNPDPEDESWQFGMGEIVRCRESVLSEGDVLVAFEKA